MGRLGPELAGGGSVPGFGQLLHLQLRHHGAGKFGGFRKRLGPGTVLVGGGAECRDGETWFHSAPDFLSVESGICEADNLELSTCLLTLILNSTATPI